MATGFTKTPSGILAKELMKQKALKTLGMAPIDPFQACDVMTYYRMKVKKTHPDATQGIDSCPVIQNFQELREAKDYLIRWLDNND